MRQLKKAIPALLLAALLPLSGCASMLERTVSSAEIHADYPVSSDEDATLRVESYQALVNSILYYVNEHSSSGTLRLYNYEGNAEEDLQRACADVTASEPLAAYGVRDISYLITRILTYYEVELSIQYAHSQATLDSIRTVNGTSVLRGELSAMVEEQSNLSILLLSYFNGDAAQAEALFRLAYYGNPLCCLGTDLPGFTAAFYPEEGQRRVLELTAEWPVSQEAQQKYASQLSAAATALLEAEPLSDTDHTVENLAALLRTHAVWAEDGADNALAAFTGEPVSNTGLILAMEYLCQRANIPVEPVLGTDGRGPWLIVSTPLGYRHLLPQGLIAEEPEASPEPSPEPGLEPGLEPSAEPIQPPEGEPPESDSPAEGEPTAETPDESPSPDDPAPSNPPAESPEPDLEASAGPEDPSAAPEDTDAPEATQAPSPTPAPTPTPKPEEIPLLYTDAELRLMGYQWDASLYHVCVEAELPPETTPQPVENPGENLGDMT